MAERSQFLAAAKEQTEIKRQRTVVREARKAPQTPQWQKHDEASASSTSKEHLALRASRTTVNNATPKAPKTAQRRPDEPDRKMPWGGSAADEKVAHSAKGMAGQERAWGEA